MKKNNYNEQLKSQKILDAAKELFLEKGYAGTSISDIANIAGINKSLIYHHYQNKVTLWKLVKTIIFEESAPGFLKDLEFSKDNFYNFLKELVNFRFNLYDNNPKAARMMLWQKLEDSGGELTGLLEENIISFTSYLSHFQKIGEVRNDIEPEIISYFITSNISSIFLDRPKFILSSESSRIKAQYLKMLIDILYNAFKTQDKIMTK
jgi:AcrR family transcriptional regulator